MSSQSVKPKPFLKWIGGKRRLAPRILSRLPPKIGTYYEPFLGGGAVFFELARLERFDRAVLGDSCPELMNAFQVVRNSVDGLIEALRRPEFKYDKAAYYEIRCMDPDKLDPITRAARTVYLNKTCYNGLYRVNSKGKFNTPFGDYDNPVICDEPDLRACSAALQQAELVEADFEEICTDAGCGDAIYYDPPYLPISKTAKFTQYTPDGFSHSDHKRLAAMFKQLDGLGVVQVLSNSSSIDTGMFDEFDIETIIGARSVGRPDKRASVPEILVSNHRADAPSEP